MLYMTYNTYHGDFIRGCEIRSLGNKCLICLFTYRFVNEIKNLNIK